MPRNRLVIRGDSAVQGIIKTCSMQEKHMQQVDGPQNIIEEMKIAPSRENPGLVRCWSARSKRRKCRWVNG